MGREVYGIMELIQIIILSVVQAIGEWLPISSSGHLAILHNIFGFQNLSFDVFLHFSSILAVFVIFWKDLLGLLNFKKRKNIIYILLLLLAIIPAGLVGFLFSDLIENSFSNMLFLGLFFMISGLLIYMTKFASPKKENINWADSLFIGLFQAIAIFPGVSRSGASISAGLFRGIKKELAVKFSFFMAIPLILGASVLEWGNISLIEISIQYLLISFFITFLISILTIKFLLRIIRGDRFYLFGVYNFILGIIILIYRIL